MDVDQINAKFVKERYVFHNQTLGESEEIERVVIGTAELNGREIDIKGKAKQGLLVPGQQYVFLGKWKDHPKYGRYFYFTSFCMEEPLDEQTIKTYLMQCRGVGAKTAQRIVDRFGKDTISVIRKDAKKLVGVKGVSEAIREHLAEFVKTNLDEQSVRLNLLTLFQGTGIRSSAIEKAVEKWGMEAPTLIKKNPARLLPIPGVGFHSVDNLWKKLGLPLDSRKRVALALAYSVEEACRQTGSTWISTPEAITRCVTVARVSEEAVSAAMRLCKRAKLLAEFVDENGESWVSTTKIAQEERELAEYIIKAMTDIPELDFRKMQGKHLHQGESPFQLPEEFDGLSESQLRAVESMILNPRGCIYVITGGPGTGKTFVAARWIKAVRRIFPEAKIAACAPTGKAASRLQESMVMEGVSLFAYTTHQLLGVTARDGETWQFFHWEKNPLGHDLIVVDEPSIIDQPIMLSLLKARKKGAVILFIADTNQLPPVGIGKPMFDLLTQDIPQAELTEVHRNAGEIARVCDEIKHVKPGILQRKRRSEPTPLILKKISQAKAERKKTPSEVVWINTNGPSETIAELIRLIKQIEESGWSPIDDIQTIVSVNNASEVSRSKLNAIILDTLNQSGNRTYGFAIGDKVINNKNRFIQHATREISERYLTAPPDIFESGNRSEEVVRISNGEIGRIVDISQQHNMAMIKIDNPQRLVMQHFDVENKRLPDWDLAYAITCHKFQGSQAPFVAVILDQSTAATMIMSRNWIYTAASRAKLVTFLIGPNVVFERAIRKQGLDRKTLLKENLESLCGPSKLHEVPTPSKAEIESILSRL